jgi:hypothetical protein
MVDDEGGGRVIWRELISFSEIDADESVGRENFEELTLIF